MYLPINLNGFPFGTPNWWPQFTVMGGLFEMVAVNGCHPFVLQSQAVGQGATVKKKRQGGQLVFPHIGVISREKFPDAAKL